MRKGSDSDDELFLYPPQTTSPHQLVHLQGAYNTHRQHSESFSSENDETVYSKHTGNGILMSVSAIQDSSSYELPSKHRARKESIVDGLLNEIYDRWHYGRRDSFDSDTLTECSSTSDIWSTRHEPASGYLSAIEKRHGGQLTLSFLQNQSSGQLKRMLFDLQRSTAVMSGRLIRQLKRRDRRLSKLQRNSDVVTAILQAASLKRQIDTRMKFSLKPPPGQSAFDQWRDAMKAVARLPMGIPPEFRKKVWLSLADHYLCQLKVNWEKTVRFVFNERSNPDDDKLGMQIVKDLHRTGCSNFSGEDNEEDRAVLKRVLLAYARWNKKVGYCQGFNVIAALLLNVMDRKEDDALKVMIYLIDSVLPESYFANNLRALSVDMAVFRDLLRLTYTRLSKHLDKLQLAAQDVRTGACYEPPLTNVFTMQWFLTLFATCLPIDIVLRVWDSVLLEGSEILLRTALTIWGKLAQPIMIVSSADEFYSLMGELSSSIMQGTILDGDTLVKRVYALGDFPLSHLNELREKYTYNIRPFTSAATGSKKGGSRGGIKSVLYSDEDELDDDDITAMACMPGDMASSASDISVLGPGVYGSGIDPATRHGAVQLERMSTDIHSLKLQYQRLKERQKQAHILIAAAAAKKSQPSSRRQATIPVIPAPALVPTIESPTAMNHLFVGKASSRSKNRLVTHGPKISAPKSPPKHSGVLAMQMQAVANARAVSKSNKMKTGKTARSPNRSSTDLDTVQDSITEETCTSEKNDLDIDTKCLNYGKDTSPKSEAQSATKPQKNPEKETLNNDLEYSTTKDANASAQPKETTLCQLDMNLKREVNIQRQELDNPTKANIDISEGILVNVSSKSINENNLEENIDLEDSKDTNSEVKILNDSENISMLQISNKEGQDLVCMFDDFKSPVFSTMSVLADSDVDSPGFILPSTDMVKTYIPSHEEEKDNKEMEEDLVITGEEGVATITVSQSEYCTKETSISNIYDANSLLDDESRNLNIKINYSDLANGCIDSQESEQSDLRTLSTGSNNSQVEVNNLLNEVEETSPVKQQGYIRSVSFVENLTTEEYGLDSSLNGSNSQVSQLSNETIAAPSQSIVRKIGEHTMIISQKPPDAKKQSRRFSTPAVISNNKPFNPFPVKHFNANRAKTGLKLGLYTPSTLKQLKGLNKHCS